MRAALTAPALFALSLTLGGCASFNAPRDEQSHIPGTESAWKQHRKSLQPIDRFLANGRVASSELALRADLRWQQSANGGFELRLAGPFGAGAVELRGTPYAVEVRSGGKVECTLDPEGWIRSNYGWSLPVSGLRYWVLGMPIPGKPVKRVLDEAGRLAHMEQNGWTLDYLEYRRVGDYDLPRRFEVDNGQVKLKLLIDRWDDLPNLSAQNSAKP